MITRFIQLVVALYGFVLRTVGIAESRCSYCKKLTGFKRGRSFRGSYFRKDPLLAKFPFMQSHGICKTCNEIYFPEAKAKVEPQDIAAIAGDFATVMEDFSKVLAPFVEKNHRGGRQRLSRKNMRRRLGGWGGAAALCL